MKTIPISIIIRNKNNGATILRAIDSVNNQSIPDLVNNIILIDDGSTDDSIELVQERYSTVKVYQSSKNGAVAALNYGLSICSSPYYTILDADDALPTKAIEYYLEEFASNPKIAMLYGNYIERSSSGLETVLSTKENIFNTIAGGIVFSTDVVKALGGYDPDLFFPEYDLLIKTLDKQEVAHINKTVYYYFRQPTSLTSNTLKVAEGIRQLKSRYGKEFPIRKY